MRKAGRVSKIVLEQHNISQSKLTDRLGVGRLNVYRWANEVRDSTSETVIAIIQTLETLNPDAAADFKRLYMESSSKENG